MLLDDTGSVELAATVTWFEMRPVAVSATGLISMVTVELALAESVPRLQTVVAPALQDPWVAIADATTTPCGITSVSTTEVDGAPLLVTVNV